MISLPFAAALGTAVLSTSFISGIFGMAAGIILLGILLALTPLPTAMVLHGITQAAANGWRTWLWLEHVRWPVVGRYAVGAIAATLAFSAAEVSLPKPAVLVLLGLLSLIGLVLPIRYAPNVMRPWQACLCGAICTLLQLFAGVSGSVIDVCFARSGLDRKGIIATKGAVQTLGHTAKAAYFTQALVLGGSGVAPLALILAVSLALVGTQSSRRLLDAISDTQFRRWTRALIVAVSCFYLVQGVTLLL